MVTEDEIRFGERTLGTPLRAVSMMREELHAPTFERSKFIPIRKDVSHRMRYYNGRSKDRNTLEQHAVQQKTVYNVYYLTNQQ